MVLHWRRAGFSVADARAWLTAGVTTPAEASAHLEKGTSPRAARDAELRARDQQKRRDGTYGEWDWWSGGKV